MSAIGVAMIASGLVLLIWLYGPVHTEAAKRVAGGAA